MPGSIIMGKDGDTFRQLKCDSDGRLECSVDALEITAENINLNVNDLETLTTAGNNTLSSIDNKIILPSVLNSDQLKVNDSACVGGLAQVNNSIQQLVGHNDGVETLLTALDAAQDLTNTRLNTINSTLGDTNSKIDATRGSSDLGAVNTSIGLVRQDLTDGSAKAKAMGADVHNGQFQLRTDGDGHLQVDCLTNALPTGASTADNQTNGNAIVKIMGSEDATTGGTQRQIHIDGNGNLQTNIVNTIFQVPANSANSHITDDPANSMAVGLKGRTTIGTATTETFLLCDTDGKQIVKSNTNASYGSEVSYVSGQSISGSGDHTGASITLDANVKAIYAEHNFSHTGIKFEILGSIDGSNFLSTGVEFNAGGMTPATLTGLSTILGTNASVAGFPPHIKFKFSNSDSSSQTATLSYVIQTN